MLANSVPDKDVKSSQGTKVVRLTEFHDYNAVIKEAHRLGKRHMKEFNEKMERYLLVKAAITNLQSQTRIKDRISDTYTIYSFYSDFAKRASLILCDLAICVDCEKLSLNLRCIAYSQAWLNNSKVDGKLYDHVVELCKNGFEERDFDKEGWRIPMGEFKFFDKYGTEDRKVLKKISELPKIKRVLDFINKGNESLNLKVWEVAAIGSEKERQADDGEHKTSDDEQK